MGDEHRFPMFAPPLHPGNKAHTFSLFDNQEWARRYVIQAELSDHQIVTLAIDQPIPALDRPWNLVGWISGVVSIAILLASLCVRWLTTPLQRLARASQQLSNNLDLPQIQIEGPEETAQPAKALNRLHSEVRRTVESLSHALTGLSHDIRLPMTRIRLRLETIEQQKTRQGIENDLADIDEMLQRTLEYLKAGPTSESFSTIDINALLDAITDDLEGLGRQINREGSARSPIRAQGFALKRCLANIIDNAIRYGSDPITISVSDTTKELKISISDQGPGIDTKDFDRVFDPYVRLEPSRNKSTGGTGLGMAIARAIVRSHQGNITLTNNVPHGLIVTIHLPRQN